LPSLVSVSQKLAKVPPINIDATANITITASKIFFIIV